QLLIVGNQSRLYTANAFEAAHRPAAVDEPAVVRIETGQRQEERTTRWRFCGPADGLGPTTRGSTTSRRGHTRAAPCRGVSAWLATPARREQRHDRQPSHPHTLSFSGGATEGKPRAPRLQLATSQLCW